MFCPFCGRWLIIIGFHRFNCEVDGQIVVDARREEAGF